MLVEDLRHRVSTLVAIRARARTHLERHRVKEFVIRILEKVELDQISTRELLARHGIRPVQADELAPACKWELVPLRNQSTHRNNGEKLVDGPYLGTDGRLERLEREGTAVV